MRGKKGKPAKPGRPTASGSGSLQGAPVDTGDARGFLAALRKEYVKGDEGAVGDFFNSSGLDGDDMERLQPFEDRVRDSQDPARTIRTIEQEWSRKTRGVELQRAQKNDYEAVSTVPAQTTFVPAAPTPTLQPLLTAMPAQLTAFPAQMARQPQYMLVPNQAPAQRLVQVPSATTYVQQPPTVIR